MPFREFMQAALYDPRHGYYTQGRDRFGRQGDFYTAAQVQPVFSRLVRRIAQRLLAPSDIVIDLGAGREEMREAFTGWCYIPVDVNRGSAPERFRGLVFANEFFDALPVDIFEAIGGRLHERLVSLSGNSFFWTLQATSETTELPDGFLLERSPFASMHLQSIARSMEAGRIWINDYGYTERERIRFPQGTLMSYREHHADPDVLVSPGERDITAHVDFTGLQNAAVRSGFEVERFETLASTLLRAGKTDDFAEALAGDELRHRQQLKTLLFGMGETFRTLLLRRAK